MLVFPGPLFDITQVTPTAEALLAFTTLSTVSLWDIRTGGACVAQLPFKYPLDATADDTHLYICNAEFLKILDRRMLGKVVTQLTHLNTVRNVRISHSAPLVMFTSTHGESLLHRDCAVRAWARENGEWKCQGTVEFNSGVRALASCGDHAVAIGQKGALSVGCMY